MTFWPFILSRCADCGVGTITIQEWYMVKTRVWKQAWAGRLKPWHAMPGQQVLCIGCLENRLGRKLMHADFTRSPINNPTKRFMSERLCDRVTRRAAS